MRKFEAGGRDVLVGNAGGKRFAIDDTCTHAGASLAEGRMDGGSVVCGWHGARFGCATGKLEAFPAKIADLGRYEVDVSESGEMSVEVPA